MEVRVDGSPPDDRNTHGKVPELSDVVQWTLPDFLSIEASTLPRDNVSQDRYVQSPKFSLAGFDWRLRVYPKGRDGVRGWVSAHAEPCSVGRHREGVALGWKRADGTVEERAAYEFDDVYNRLRQFLSLEELDRRHSELMPSGAFTLTCRIERWRNYSFRVLNVDPTSPRSTVEPFSESVRWIIRDFFSLIQEGDSVLRSSRFTFLGYRWRLTAHPTSDRRHLSVYLRREEVPFGTTPARGGFQVGTAFHFGLWRTDSTVEERKRGTFADFVIEGPEFSWGWPDFVSLDEIRRRKSELLSGGELTVSFRLERGGASVERVPEEPRTTTKSDPESSELQDVPGFEEEKCDVTFHVQGREFRASRSVLSSGSEVFRATFAHDTAEARTGVLEIPDCDPDSFGEFLHFLYTGRLREVSRTSACHLYVTSDKYDVQGLKKFCADYLAQTLTADNFCVVVALADLHSDERLAAAALRVFHRNCSAMEWASAWSSLTRDDPRLADKLLKQVADDPAGNPQNG